VGPLLAAWFAVEIGLGHVLRTGAWPDLAALVPDFEQRGWG
jgi:hypothetical protein